MNNESQKNLSSMARKAVFEVITLQRRIFERQRRIIESRETHLTVGFTRYRNEYRKAVSGYIDESGFGALCDEIAKTKVAYIADYHTLRLAQKTFLQLIKAVLHQADNICLAMEFVNEKYQQDLDKFLEGRIQEKTFLQRMKYKEQWPYDIWPNFKPIFDLAINRGIPIIAIDKDGSLSLRKRDKFAAEKIVKIAKKYPDATILVFAGRMHMSPSHLPAKTDLAFIKASLSAPERVIVYQNAEEIYWQLAKEGREEVEVVKVSGYEYCVNNTPPLVQQLSYLHWIQFDETFIEYSELETTVRALIKDFSQYLNLDYKDALQQVRVLMPADLDLVDILKKSKLSLSDRKYIIKQAEAEESFCIPSLELIYLATLSINHASEEAAYYLKFVVSGSLKPDNVKDLFYYLVLNKACAFFCSKIINPKRKADHAGRLRAKIARARQSKQSGVEDVASALILEHLFLERNVERNTKINQKFQDLTKNYSINIINKAADVLGYILGDRLYYGLTEGIISKKVVKSLFLAPLNQPDEAVETYLALSKMLRMVKIPKRIFN